MGIYRWFSLAIASAVIATGAWAQDYPTRPIVYVVPFPPGGVTDNFARVIGKTLGEKLGQPVVIENKPGAAGIVGTEYVANAKPDGYTILYGASGPLAAYPYLYKKLTYDPLKSFAAVHGLADSALVMMARADAPYKSLVEFIAYAKKNPGKLNFASSGSGSNQHLSAVLLQKEAGFEMTHVPYKGTSAAIVDLLSGVIDVMFDYPVIMKPQIEAGKLVALGVTDTKRLVALPNVPTFVEQGYSGMILTAWASIVVPAGTPQPIIDRLSQAISASLEDPIVVKYFQDQGAGIMPGMSKERLRDFMVSEGAKFKELIERSGATAD